MDARKALATILGIHFILPQFQYARIFLLEQICKKPCKYRNMEIT